MSMEEKLERLTERTDALTKSLELMAATHRDYEARADARMEKQDRNIDRLVGIVEKMADSVETMADSIKKPGKTVGGHQRRISDVN
jgi:methyl-accepting chemotaxis protein